MTDVQDTPIPTPSASTDSPNDSTITTTNDTETSATTTSSQKKKKNKPPNVNAILKRNKRKNLKVYSVLKKILQKKNLPISWHLKAFFMQ